MIKQIDPKRYAVLVITPDLLKSYLNLPDGVIIRSVQMKIADDHRDVIEVVVQNAGWVVPEGGQIPQTSGVTYIGGKSDWGFPIRGDEDD